MKKVEGLLHTLLELSLFGYLFRVGKGAAIADEFRTVQWHIALLCQLQALTAGARMVKRNTVEPGRKIRVPTKLANRLKSGEKRLLSYLGGLVIVTQETVDEVERRLLVPPYQNFEGISVTPLHPFDAFRIAYTLDKHWLKYIRL
jgi:hypothetical protein